ncbi:tetratricopeptide repeat protein [Spirochaeta africana]|uniref:Tetratricopeptide repeat protein n=1 Tax=Spirochaeta africana (strain ATCC 700263 / DSM 8902 / Z-7692) TaxID=889378 RepID=H9UJ79_SPIAZ|nr:tetratricopeptide repeat protein [Spirochaeta africana]AFG37572.1 hypothetical protein Spiaf_1513 [Spirochaeta africana DSM 8902]
MSKQMHVHQQEKPSVAETVMHFISRFRTVFIVVGIVIVAAVIAGFTIQHVRQSRIEASAEIAVQLNQSYQQWLQAGDDEAGMFREQFMSAYNEATDRFSGMYAAELAEFLYGQISFAEQNYAEAAGIFSGLAGSADSHLAPLSAMNAAVAFEAAGDTDAALEAYQELLQRFADRSPEAPRAQFALGRLNEDRDLQAAIAHYEDLIDAYPDSDWANLAESRIIHLRTVE